MRPAIFVNPLWLLVISISWVACSGPVREVGAGGGPGFSEAVFDEKKLLDIMDRKGSEGLRLYSALRTKTDKFGTIMAIGTTADGKDDVGALSEWYAMSDRVVGSGVAYFMRPESAALTAVKFVREVGDSAYATNFKEDDIRAMLAEKDCNGIRIAPKEMDEKSPWTMVIHAVKISDGTAVDIGSIPELLCGEPCPRYCGGDPSFYLNQR